MSFDTFEINASPDELATMTAQLDAAESRDFPNASANDGDRTPEPKTPEAKVPETPEAQAEAKPKDSSSTPDASKTPETKPADDPNAKKSNYAREMDRRDKSWKALNEEKEAFKAQQAELAQQRQKFQQEREAALAAEPEFTAEQYLIAAKKFGEEGRIDLEQEAIELANHIKANPPELAAVQRKQAARIGAQQQESLARALGQTPDLGKPGTPLNLEAQKIVSEDPHVWNTHPNAWEHLARVATARLQAARVPELEKDLSKAQARVAELEKLTSVGPQGGPAGQLPETNQPDDEGAIRAAVRAADAGR
jgi:hypothetical protein